MEAKPFKTDQVEKTNQQTKTTTTNSSLSTFPWLPGFLPCVMDLTTSWNTFSPKMELFCMR